MLCKTRQELYEYLNHFDFQAKQDSPISSVYFLVKYGDTIEPIYFMPYEDVWFESPCEVRSFKMPDDEVIEFVKEMYGEEYWEDAYKYESIMQKDGWHYDIDVPQCSPFLPDEVEIVKPLSEGECLEWVLEHWTKDKKNEEE